MKRILGIAAAAVAIGSIAAVAPATPAHAAEVANVCVTLTSKTISLTVNGEDYGGPVAEAPRRCVGV